MTYQKNKKQRLTSNFVILKIIASAIFLKGGMLLVHSIINHNGLETFGSFVVLIIGILIWIIALTRNTVYYDGATFHIFSWRDEWIDSVPHENVTSMLFSGSGINSARMSYRLFYRAKDGTKKDFWIVPNLRTDTHVLKAKLKKINPELLTTGATFGLIEHFFVKNEDWFR